MSVKTIFIGDLQGSVVDSILFNIFFHDFLYFILITSAHDFADSSTLFSFAKKIRNLTSILESESKIATN